MNWAKIAKSILQGIIAIHLVQKNLVLEYSWVYTHRSLKITLMRNHNRSIQTIFLVLCDF